jgi:hypothetical protein
MSPQAQGMRSSTRAVRDRLSAIAGGGRSAAKTKASSNVLDNGIEAPLHSILVQTEPIRNWSTAALALKRQFANRPLLGPYWLNLPSGAKPASSWNKSAYIGVTDIGPMSDRGSPYPPWILSAEKGAIRKPFAYSTARLNIFGLFTGPFYSFQIPSF